MKATLEEIKGELKAINSKLPATSVKPPPDVKKKSPGKSTSASPSADPVAALASAMRERQARGVTPEMEAAMAEWKQRVQTAETSRPASTVTVQRDR